MASIELRVRDLDVVRALAKLRPYVRPALFALFAVNMVALTYYVFIGYQPDFHSDSAVKNLLAGEVIETGQYFPDDWNYVNGDLWTFFGQIFIIPLLHWFPNGFALHAVSGLVSAILILWSGWLVSGLATRSSALRLLVACILAGGISKLSAENLYGQVSYGNVFFTAAFSLYFSWRFLQAGGRGAACAWGAALFMLNALVFWANPQRAVAYDALPLVASACAWGCRDWSWRACRVGMFRSRAVWLCTILTISSLIGVVLHSWILAQVNNNPGAGSARWLTFTALLQNVGYTIQGMVDFFGGTLPPGASVMSLGGAYMAMRFVASLALLVLMPIAVLRALESGSDSRRFVGAFAGSSMALFLFVHLTTTTPDMSDPISSARYLVPSLVFCLIVFVAVLGEADSAPLLRISAMALSAILALAPISPQHTFNRIWKGGSADSRIDLAHFLEKEGLHYGYATYWNAGVISVLSGERVRVRQVFVAGLPKPMRHLNSNRWYRRDAWAGRSFLMLTEEEWSHVDVPRLVALVGEPERELHWGSLRIAVFRRNLAELPGWSDRAEDVLPVTWRADSLTPHTAGRLSGAGADAAIVSAPGESGFLSYGPYIDLPRGRYVVSFDVRCAQGASSSVPLGRVDVALAGRSIAAQPILTGQQGPLRLEFELTDASQSVEFRTYVDGKEEVRFLGMSMRPVGTARQPLTH